MDTDGSVSLSVSDVCTRGALRALQVRARPWHISVCAFLSEEVRVQVLPGYVVGGQRWPPLLSCRNMRPEMARR